MLEKVIILTPKLLRVAGLEPARIAPRDFSKQEDLNLYLFKKNLNRIAYAMSGSLLCLPVPPYPHIQFSNY